MEGMEWKKVSDVLPPGACSDCGGLGHVDFVTAVTPDTPEGVDWKPCDTCGGSGRVRCRKNISHVKPCGPDPAGDEMTCACGCAADDVFCTSTKVSA